MPRRRPPCAPLRLCDIAARVAAQVPAEPGRAEMACGRRRQRMRAHIATTAQPATEPPATQCQLRRDAHGPRSRIRSGAGDAAGTASCFETGSPAQPCSSPDRRACDAVRREQVRLAARQRCLIQRSGMEIWPFSTHTRRKHVTASAPCQFVRSNGRLGAAGERGEGGTSPQLGPVNGPRPSHNTIAPRDVEARGAGHTTRCQVRAGASRGCAV